MKMLRTFLLACFGFMAAALPAQAQRQAVASCPGATAIQPAGSSGAVALVDVNGNICIAGTITPSGTQDINLKQIGGATAAQGHGTAAAALRVELPTDGTGIVGAQQNGTWTVQPGNTANTTPWLITPFPSSASGAALAPVATGALATSLVLKASAGNLYSLNVSADSTLSGAAWWVMVHNATAAPAAGAVTPLKCYALASGTTMLALAFITPIRFSTGVSVTVGTTGCFTQTDSAHAFISGDAS